jgi:glyoxylase I family protein
MTWVVMLASGLFQFIHTSELPLPKFAPSDRMRLFDPEMQYCGDKDMIVLSIMLEGAMILIRHIDHIVLRVIDLERMLAFYCGVLGCTVERRQQEIGLIQLRAGSNLLDLVPVDGKLGRMGGAAPGAEGRNLDHVCFRVEPFDPAAIASHLALHGVDAGPLASRYGAEGEGPSIYLQDPEGNTIELKGPPA